MKFGQLIKYNLRNIFLEKSLKSFCRRFGLLFQNMTKIVLEQSCKKIKISKIFCYI